MRAPIFVRPLADAEDQALKAGLHSSDAFVLRRSQIVLGSARGKPAGEIATDVGCSHETVRLVIHGFNTHGLAVLEAQSRRPHHTQAAFDAEGVERLRDMLHRSPRELGKPTSVWTLELAAEASFEQGLTAKQVSGETIRASLARMGIKWQRAKRWISSPDPAYTRKKTPVTG